MLAFALICGLATGALLLSEARDSQRGRWISKPVASLGFVGFGVAAGGLESGWGQAVLAALLLSLVGDLLLIPKDHKRAFLGGIGAFLLAHVAFAGGFLLLGIDPVWTAGASGALVLLAIVVGRWLLPSVGPELKGAVVAYIVVITAMVALAVGAWAAGATPLIPLAATIFFCSDLSVAQERFKRPAFVNKLWGLPAYYGAQLLFGLTVMPG